jgi:hypothetical protein
VCMYVCMLQVLAVLWREIRNYVHVHVCTHACAYTYMYTYILTYILQVLAVCRHAGIRIYIHVYIHIHIHIAGASRFWEWNQKLCFVSVQGICITCMYVSMYVCMYGLLGVESET